MEIADTPARVEVHRQGLLLVLAWQWYDQFQFAPSRREVWGIVEFQSVKVPRLSETIAAQIEQLVIEGALKPGERLPPERELAQKLAVSRPSLREAIVVLESRGLLESRRGGGTFVCDLTAPGLTDPLMHLMESHPETAYDILELRAALEQTAAYFAALRRTESDREILRRRFDAMDLDPEHYDAVQEAELDTEFHLALADASHNVALVHVMRGLFLLLRGHITRNLEKLHSKGASREAIRAQHQAILEAVEAGEPEAARAAAGSHLEFVAEHLKAGDAHVAREQSARRRLSSLSS